jgi:amidase
MAAPIPAWKLAARQRRQLQLSLIPQEWRLENIPSAAEAKCTHPIVESCGILTPFELEITNPSNSAPYIISKIHTSAWSSHDVTLAFCKRAAVVQQLTSCLTEIFFDAALAQAKQLDEILLKTGEPVGPLHGLPLSLKDSQGVQGVEATNGWLANVGRPAANDHPSVAAYRKLGAVLYVKTNIPQSTMMSDSYNHIFGQSVNSLNRHLISGGSSGGEGALVASAGSVLGIGTDVGGSLRVPSTLQGLYGLCPTIGRIGNRDSARSQANVIPPVAGPMAKDLDSIEYFFQSYLSCQPWKSDPIVMPIPWRQYLVDEIASGSKKLKIGYIVDDGAVLPQPPVQRAVLETVEKLKAAGHEVVPWDATSHAEGYAMWLKAVLADGGRDAEKMCRIGDEPLVPGMLTGTTETYLDADQRQSLGDEVFEYQAEYLAKWQASNLDALITPTTQWVGLLPKAWVQSDMYIGYSAIFNVLNWTAFSVPAITVSKDKDKPSQEWIDHKGRSFSDRFNHDYYDVDLFDGMPVGVQIVTGRFGEEKAIGIAKVLRSM